MSRPGYGEMCYWRQKGALEWRFGYVSRVGQDLIRMGWWNGDETNGPVVDPFDIEWKKYTDHLR